MRVIEEIKAYARAVVKGEVACSRTECPCCGGTPGEFHPHERRSRLFLVIVGTLVQLVRGRLVRWKCDLCGKTFTDYPPFAVPRKRYVAQSLVGRARQYVEADALTYRRAVLQERMPISYEGEAGETQGRQLSPTTLWRWVGLAGGLKETLREALALVKAKAPACVIFRFVPAIAPWKYQSTRRRRVLERAARVFEAARICRGLFGVEIFPDFGTRVGWR